MFEPSRDQFGRLVALYRVTSKTSVKVQGATEAREYPTGALVEAVGYPAAELAPLNWEATFAKLAAIHRQLQRDGWLFNAPVIARSLGASPGLDQVASTSFIEAWVREKAKRINDAAREAARRKP